MRVRVVFTFKKCKILDNWQKNTRICNIICTHKYYDLELNAEDDNDGALLSTLLIKLVANLSIESAHSAYVVPSPLKALQF